MKALGIAESVAEDAALAWLEAGGWTVEHGPDLAPDTPRSERGNYSVVSLESRLQDALRRLNPTLPVDALEDAGRKLQRSPGATLSARNHALHKMLVDGVPIEYRSDGAVRGAQVRVIDFERPEENDWLAVNQFSVLENRNSRRADIVLFVNGLPLALIELKNPADEKATIWTAYNQLQTYMHELPTLFSYNALLVVSDGMEARIGTITSSKEWFKPWRSMTARRDAGKPELQAMIEGAFDKQRMLDLIRHFIVFDQTSGGEPIKILAGYHQVSAVNVAIAETLRATGAGKRRGATQGGEPGDKRAGVVWHTQGSGKSLTMAFYAGRVIQHHDMANPTIVMLTDRNDLDEQLFGTFSRCQELLRQPPVQAANRADLREKLKVEAGGVVFTTIQKFFPEVKGDKHALLSDRRNIVVVADEAHRSQYDFLDGFAKHMRDALPNATFIGFTGTPIDSEDRSTRSVFGEYISVYDIERAVEDGATVPIYYEGRLAKLNLDEKERPKIDPDFEEVTEGLEEDARKQQMSRWARLEAMVGTEKRIAQVAADLVEHFEKRCETITDGQAMKDGKAMVVCMSRRICVELYNAIVKLRPAWDADDDREGAIKIVMTGSASDDKHWQRHIRSKSKREELAKRFKNPADPLRIVIVRDMWLTGFDAPCLHTMYLDKPMQGHTLMQAIARVNRVFRDKPGGLVVDYLGLADQLKKALATYTEAGGDGRPTLDQEEALRALREKCEVVRGMFHGFNYQEILEEAPADRLVGFREAMNFVVTPQLPGEAPDERKQRFMNGVSQLSKAFALAVPHEAALGLREEVGFFQGVRAGLAKIDAGERQYDQAAVDAAVRQIVSRTVVPDGVVDIFAVAGLKRPDISILDDRFLAEIKDMPQRNLAVEALRRLLKDEIKARTRKNLVQSHAFSEKLEEAIRKYQNRAIEAAAVIEELIGLAKDLRDAQRRGEALKLNDDEVAFYDALGVNDSAVAVLGDDTLKTIARELVDKVRGSVTIDWTLRENVRAQLRVMVKRILRKHGYPPDKQERATDFVLEQAEHLSPEWAAG